jgi:hypothetical protein
VQVNVTTAAEAGVKTKAIEANIAAAVASLVRQARLRITGFTTLQFDLGLNASVRLIEKNLNHPRVRSMPDLGTWTAIWMLYTTEQLNALKRN